MSRKRFQVEVPATVNERQPQTTCIRSRAYFPADADGKDGRPITDLQDTGL